MADVSFARGLGWSSNLPTKDSVGLPLSFSSCIAVAYIQDGRIGPMHQICQDHPLGSLTLDT
jgi:hypothetical protein